MEGAVQGTINTSLKDEKKCPFPFSNQLFQIKLGGKRSWEGGREREVKKCSATAPADADAGEKVGLITLRNGQTLLE